MFFISTIVYRYSLNGAFHLSLLEKSDHCTPNHSFIGCYFRDAGGVDQALSVLSRALEANKDDSELWSHYLQLYMKRADTSDIYHLCQQALNYAPSQLLYYKVSDVIMIYFLQISLF